MLPAVEGRRNVPAAGDVHTLNPPLDVHNSFAATLLHGLLRIESYADPRYLQSPEMWMLSVTQDTSLGTIFEQIIVTDNF